MSLFSFPSPGPNVARVELESPRVKEQKRSLARDVLYNLGRAISMWEQTGGTNYRIPISQTKAVMIDGKAYTRVVKTALAVDYRRRRLFLGDVSVGPYEDKVVVTTPRPKHQTWGDDPKFFIRDDNSVISVVEERNIPELEDGSNSLDYAFEMLKPWILDTGTDIGYVFDYEAFSGDAVCSYERWQLDQIENIREI